MPLAPPNRVLSRVHDVLRLPPSRHLHDPIHSWTTVNLHGPTPAHPAAIAIECWLIAPTPTIRPAAMTAMTAKLRFSAPPGTPPSIRCPHPRLHSMLIRAFEREPSCASKDVQALVNMFPETAPNTTWHILCPVPIDGRITLPPQSVIHTASTATSVCRNCSIRIEMHPQASDNNAYTPRITAKASTPTHISPLALQTHARSMVKPFSPIWTWLHDSHLRQRFRHIHAHLRDHDSLLTAALDSLCPLIEIHAHDHPDPSQVPQEPTS